MKIVTGQVLYLVPLGNFARDRKGMIYSVIVESIGRKYGTITCNEIYFTRETNNQFDLETLENNNGDYSPQYILYTDFNDINNKPKLIEELKSKLHNLSYKQLQSVNEYIEFITSKL